MSKLIRLHPSAGRLAFSQPQHEIVEEELQAAISQAQENLLRLQKPDGYWVGELMVDSTLCSDYVLYMHWRGKVDAILQEKCVRHIRKMQLARRRLEHLSRRPERDQRVRQGVLRAQAGRAQPAGPVDDRGAREHPAPGRHPAHEHLRQALPGVARASSRGNTCPPYRRR